MSKSNKAGIADKVAGAIFGFAIGDAMGATTEFMSANEVRQKYGIVDNIVGGGWLNLKPGQVTDDTEMMLCVAEGYRASVASGTDFTKEVSQRFIDWYSKGPVDCGNACVSGIKRIANGQGVKYDSSTLGNGALMRALPMAIVDRFSLNLIQADLTHCNRTQHHFISEYHNMVVRHIYGEGHGTDIGWCPDGFYPNLNEPTGHVANTLYCAVEAIEDSNGFEQVIVKCVNNGGDADTIAAVAGGLAGAKYGFDHIPVRWIYQLDASVQLRLAEVVEFLVHCCEARYACR